MTKDKMDSGLMQAHKLIFTVSMKIVSPTQLIR